MTLSITYIARNEIAELKKSLQATRERVTLSLQLDCVFSPVPDESEYILVWTDLSSLNAHHCKVFQVSKMGIDRI